jgi:cell division protein ZapE
MELDQNQQRILQVLKELALGFAPESLLVKITRLFKKDKKPIGLYLHGGVGRGKTMLMREFYNSLRVKKEIVHYQSFMQELHIKAHSLQNHSGNKVIEEIAGNIAARSQVVCLDEFEIKDITDAMIIQRLIKYLLKERVFIFITTNTAPENLYKDGLQRELFLPFIGLVQKKFLVLHLDSAVDYRFLNIADSSRRVIYPLNAASSKEMQDIIDSLCNKEEMAPSSVEVFGREVVFQKTHTNILFTNFAELFERELGYADYVNIAKSFRIVVLEGVRVIEEAETDIVTRFINFIDNAYFYKILLFISLDKSPEETYKLGKKKDEFIRTISRLKEMNSSNYLKEIADDKF